MRPIDADRVQEKIEKKLTEPSYQHEGEDWQNGLIVAEMFIDYAPTVDAIPIEWIESQVDKGKWAELVQRWAERKEE